MSKWGVMVISWVPFSSKQGAALVEPLAEGKSPPRRLNTRRVFWLLDDPHSLALSRALGACF